MAAAHGGVQQLNIAPPTLFVQVQAAPWGEV